MKPHLTRLEHPSNRVWKPEVQRQPGRLTWSAAVAGQSRVQEEAWCEALDLSQVEIGFGGVLRRKAG